MVVAAALSAIGVVASHHLWYGLPLTPFQHSANIRSRAEENSPTRSAVEAAACSAATYCRENTRDARRQES